MKTRKRLPIKPFPSPKYFMPDLTPHCPTCKRPIDVGKTKLTKREKAAMPEEGYTSLRMGDGVEILVPHRNIELLLTKVSRVLGAIPPPLPRRYFGRWPELFWFKGCISAESSDDNTSFRLLLDLVRPPTPAPQEKAS
jgi:hypothetical protein